MTPPFAAAPYIREIGRGAKGARSLSRQDTQTLFTAMLAGTITELELGAILLAWRIKGESAEELAGMLEAAHASCRPLTFPATPDKVLPVIIPSYNGARKQPNLVPLLALLLAREGIPVLVHGIPAFNGRITSATLFSELGLPICHSTEQAGQQLAEQRVAFLPIGTLSPALAALLAKRDIIGLRNSAHTIVKMLQPIGHHGDHEALRLVNYTHPEYLQTLTQFFTQYPANVLLARGTEGEAVADARRLGKMLWLKQGQQQPVAEAEAGTISVPPTLPSGLDAVATVTYIRAVLDGQQPTPAPIAAQVAIIARLARTGEISSA